MVAADPIGRNSSKPAPAVASPQPQEGQSKDTKLLEKDSRGGADAANLMEAQPVFDSQPERLNGPAKKVSKDLTGNSIMPS